VAVVGDVYRFLATGEDTNGKYALLEAIVPPGGGPPPHVHSREEEGFYILEGEITSQASAPEAGETGKPFIPTVRHVTEIVPQNNIPMCSLGEKNNS